ncbi:PQQ-binding-like beta-propeller repeat protein [Streptomyces cavernae]|uniref:serine/threonine-protein kinase n=1 Tax=Streptomyces cavernae TaxID=2259034 RepID=UPI000FEB7AF8|nr:serine/threonine-protein kinase [Streptomyces cavernae]
MQELEIQDPRTVGEFRLLGCLGQGGFGRVFLGRAPSGSLAAVKVAHGHHAQDRDFRERFRREVTAIRRVSGWFTAALVAADTETRQPWLATEFVPAPTLHDVVAACGPLPPPALWWIARGIAEALVSIHRAGLLHRDLKPGNVLLAPDGVRVIDFGIAKVVDSANYTRPGVAAGTPGFMPPEQVDLRGVGTPGDVYALAATLLYAASGHPPHTGANWHQVFQKLISHAAPDLSGLPAEFSGLVPRCLQASPESRMSAPQVLAVARRKARPGPGGPGTAGAGAGARRGQPRVLPDQVLAYISGYERRVTPPTTAEFGPTGTLRLPDAVRTRWLSTPWRLAVDGLLPSSPLVIDRAVYVSDSSGHVYAADTLTGRELWRRSVGRGALSAPAGRPGLVIVGGRGQVTALDAARGEVRWRHAIDCQVAARPTVAGATVHVSGRAGVVRALDAGTGEPLWRYDTGGGAASDSCAVPGLLYVGDEAGRLHALRATTGERLWRYATGGAVESAPTVAGGVVYAGSADACVYALDERTGRLLWRHHTGGPVRSSPTVLDGTVFVGSTDGGVYALDAAHGGVRWRYRTGGAIRCTPVVSGGVLYAGSLDEQLYALDADTGVLRWRYRTGGWLAASPSVAGGFVYASSQDKHVYALDALTGAGPVPDPARQH